MNASNLTPGPKLDALVAEKVMGLHVEWRNGQPLWVGKDLPGSPYVLGDGLFGHTINPYSTDIAAAWQVEEKISELRITLPYTDALKHLCKVSENDVPMTFDLVHASPLLRCQAALLALTYLDRARS